MSARNLIEVDPRCGIGSSCRLIGSSDRNFPSESSQLSLSHKSWELASRIVFGVPSQATLS